MPTHFEEEKQMRSAALKTAQSILVARQCAEQELLATKEALERKTDEFADERAMLESGVRGLIERAATARPRLPR